MSLIGSDRKSRRKEILFLEGQKTQLDWHQEGSHVLWQLKVKHLQVDDNLSSNHDDILLQPSYPRDMAEKHHLDLAVE